MPTNIVLPAPIPLSTAALQSLSLPVPGYDRSRVSVGIVHIGVGGFHRAHQALYIDRLMNAGLAMDWGICGMGLLPSDAVMRDALLSQDCLYTLAIKQADGTVEARVVGSIIDFVYVPDNPEYAIEKLADPDVRIVSLTITEGGYNFDRVTGAFDPTHPDVVHDLEAAAAGMRGEPAATPRTVFGLVGEAMSRRRGRGIAPFAVMSCDNIPRNGDVARRQFVSYADLYDHKLAGWINREAAFPNSMVDRITPVTSSEDRLYLVNTYGIDDRCPVVCEAFSQWVLEDCFEGERSRPPLETVGVQLVSLVEPYELMKLRLLNASHQALCYAGYLSGYRFVHEACADKEFAAFLQAYMDREATPTLKPVPGIDLDAYKHQLIRRFESPVIRDTLARICGEASDRISKFLLPVIRDNLDAGRPVDLSAAIVASWARYAEGVDEEGSPITIVDQLRDRLTAAAAQQLNRDPLAFVRDRELFGDLVERQEFTRPYLRALNSFHVHGARATISALARVHS